MSALGNNLKPQQQVSKLNPLHQFQQCSVIYCLFFMSLMYFHTDVWIWHHLVKSCIFRSTLMHKCLSYKILNGEPLRWLEIHLCKDL